ncbi:hypothetical protein [Streptomyces sp. 049-1]|uniref:hypothetical protein n=1 Tax=Streptomyces sp. 049-1 TaxID=2789264 RepID=UPI00397EC772
MFRRRSRWTQEQGPYWKQRSWQVSAGFLSLVVGVSCLVALTSGGGDRGGQSAADKGPLSGAAVMKDGRPRDCRTDDSAGAALPKSAPKDVTWRTLGIARVPVSASAGPTRTHDTLWWCFAHTPMGAVEAAVVIPSQMSGSGWRAVSRQQVVAGHPRDLFDFQRSTVQDIDNADDAGEQAVGTYAGFSVSSYKSTAASVALLIRSSQGLSTTRVRLRWSGGDWKVVPSGGGDLHTPVTSAQNTNGFLLWEG